MVRGAAVANCTTAFLSRGAAVVNCTAAFPGLGGHWREKKESEKRRKDPWIQNIPYRLDLQGTLKYDKTKDRHIQHTPNQHSQYYRVGVLG